MLTKRIIPCLDIKDGRTVKGVNFESLRDAGDPVDLAAWYDEQGADELVFLDISATEEKRKTLTDLVSRIAKRIRIPFTIGGGIAAPDDVAMLLDAGADKVSVNSAAVRDPMVITRLAERFGRQCVTLAVDVKRVNQENWVFIQGGKLKTDWQALDWIKKGEELGAGEILLTSMDADGTKKGFDISLLKEVKNGCKLPLIASGGAGTMAHFKEAFLEGNADAALAASVFHFGEMAIRDLKLYLKQATIPVRL